MAMGMRRGRARGEAVRAREGRAAVRSSHMLSQPNLVEEQHGHDRGRVLLEAARDVELMLDGVRGAERRALVREDVDRWKVAEEGIGRARALEVV